MPLSKGLLERASAAEQPSNLSVTREISALYSSFLSNPRIRLPSLPTLVDDYDRRAGRVLQTTLPNGSIRDKRAQITKESKINHSVVTVAHVVEGPSSSESEIHIASGFFIQPTNSNPCVVTCAHTLHQARHSPILQEANASSGTLIITSAGQVLAASHVLSSLPVSDIVLLAYQPKPGFTPFTLPVSMYPAQEGTAFRTRFVSPTAVSLHGDGFATWIPGTIDGYRDFAGRESKPGTYDALSHIIFSPPPTPGTSGAPIIDEATGNVIGMVTGSRMYNRVKGLKGWGTPSEALFELFSLPI